MLPSVRIGTQGSPGSLIVTLFVSCQPPAGEKNKESKCWLRTFDFDFDDVAGSETLKCMELKLLREQRNLSSS